MCVVCCVLCVVCLTLYKVTKNQRIKQIFFIKKQDKKLFFLLQEEKTTSHILLITIHSFFNFFINAKLLKFLDNSRFKMLNLI